MARKFGIVTGVSGLTAGIVIQSLTYNETAETAEARNSTGAITDLAAYSRSTSLSISGLLDESDGTTLVSAGSTLTLGGKNYLIESVDKTESNTDFVRVSLSCRTADSATIHTINVAPTE